MILTICLIALAVIFVGALAFARVSDRKRGGTRIDPNAARAQLTESQAAAAAIRPTPGNGARGGLGGVG